MNKTTKVGLAILVLALIASGVWYSEHRVSEKPKYEGAIESLRLGNVGEYTIFNLIAKEKGFFTENGLDVEIKEYTSGPASIAGLLASEVDVTIAADFVGVRNIFDHNELRILAEVNQHRVFQLVGRKDLGISTPADLKGKKVGVTKNSAGEFFLGNFLTANALDLKDVTMVDLPPADMLAQLEEGTIDAISVFEPHVYRLRNTTKHPLTTWEIQGDQNINALAYSTSAFINQNPEKILRYMRALVQAEEYYKSHTEEIKDFIATKLKYEKAYVDYVWPRFTHEIRLDQDLLINMEAEARWVIASKLTTTTEIPNYLDYLYFDTLEKAKPYSITAIH